MTFIAPNHFRVRRALSLVEAIMATLVVSILLVSSARLAGGAARSGKLLSERASAGDIADGLIAEILTKAYADPTTPAAFGLDAGELSSSKANYNDVDDFNGWTQSYAYTGGNAANGLVASVVVTRAVLATPSVDSASETGLKHVRVTVTRQNRVLAIRDAWKADAL